MLSKMSNNALVLTGGVFAVKSYWFCHLVRTHVQQVGCKICIIQGQYFLGCLVCLRAEVQARQSLVVDVELLYLDKKMMYHRT